MTGILLAATILSLTNEHVTVDFDDKGGVSSVRERATSRELVTPSAFAGIALTNCGFLAANRTEFRDGRLVFSFPEEHGSISLRAVPFEGGWTFRVDELSAPSATAVYAGRFAPRFGSFVGRRANMVSDRRSAMCVRPYGLEHRAQCAPNMIGAKLVPVSTTGASFGVAAGPRARMPAMLKAMTVASGRAHSTGGGAWTLDTDAARNSYLNADVTAASLGDWIDLMERGGFGVLHFRERWYDCRGHYTVRREDWPNGLDDMRAAVRKIHDAGYLAGMHTLTACIDPKDPWVAGEDNRHLRARETYRLAGDIDETATELAVDSPPVCRHDTLFTYSGNGNALRIGSEIVQYSGFTKEPPYVYTGLVRGAFGTKAAPHKAGDDVAYLEQRYMAFYPDPHSPLADKVADAIANVYRTCKFDQIYCDGAEAGCGKDRYYYTGVMRDKIIRRCAGDGRPVINEDSCGGPFNVWWMHSRVGAWDSCYWAAKEFHDYHVEAIKGMNVREADLLEVQMGWWAPLLSCPHFPAQKIDEIEYYASRNAGFDASMSIAGVNVSRKPLGFHHSRMMTVLGWYERARRARAFLPEVQSAMDRKGAEFRLRQDRDTGRWMISPVWCGKGRLELKDAPRKAALRVEALYSGAPVDASALDLTGDVGAGDFKLRTANESISVKVEDGVDDSGARTICLLAENRGGVSRGAWAEASAKFSPYKSPKNRWVMRFRVKGDGSGALLNVQPHTPREFGEARSEHYITLDFNGWRDFEMPFRERDAERYPDYVWPYTGYAEVFHRILNMNNLDAVNFYLNEIPPGGIARAEITDIRLVRQVPTVASMVEGDVNGRRFTLPFPLGSGEYAELEDGRWIKYSENGAPLACSHADERVELVEGLNSATVCGRDGLGNKTRLEVRLFAVGAMKPALRNTDELPTESRSFLGYEADEPYWHSPRKGFCDLNAVAVRPGERAKVEFRFEGSLKGGAAAVLRQGVRDT